jgi:glycosyltransferase involved in cell wall biosynthesis
MSAFTECDAPVVAVSTDLAPRAHRLMLNVMTAGFVDVGGLAQSTVERRSLRLAFRENKPKLLPSRELAAVRSAILARRLRRRQPIDRVIQFGSEYRLPADTDYVTLDDATIVQLWRSYPYEWMQVVAESNLRRMIARQREIFRKARACCVLNRWAAQSIVEDYGVPPSQVHVVGTGPNRTIAAGERDWATPRFLFVGKDFRRKNGERVLEAFARVREREPRATLDVVGAHPSFSLGGVNPHGMLHPDRPDEVAELNTLFARATCLVMPSLLEPTGNVHAEALAAGIGSIGTTSGGVSTIIGDSGVTVAPHDTDELAAQMLAFCDPERAREFGRRARARAPLFTWKAVAERVIRALNLPDWQEAELADFL